MLGVASVRFKRTTDGQSTNMKMPCREVDVNVLQPLQAFVTSIGHAFVTYLLTHTCSSDPDLRKDYGDATGKTSSDIIKTIIPGKGI